METDALERYLESIGHNGPYTTDTHKCGCTNNISTAIAVEPIRTSNLVKYDAPLTKSPETILPSGNRVDGGAIEAEILPVIQEVPSRVVIDEPLFERTPSVSIDPLNTMVGEVSVIVPEIVQDTIVTDFVDPFGRTISDLPLTVTIPRTLTDELPIPNIDPGAIPPAIEENLKTSTGAQPKTTNTVVSKKPSKAGGWLLGLFVTGMIVRQFMKSGKPDKKD